MESTRLYGLMAEFDNPADLLAAARAAYAEGYRKMDAYSPMPVHGLAEALGVQKNPLPLIVLLGGLVGCLTAFGMLWAIETIIYPLNVGGRPFNSWPAFIPITFETTILFAALAAVLGMLALNGLPQPYHPVFNAPRFALATHNRFFLCIEASDPKFDLVATRRFLENLPSREVVEVAP
ncbi:MAG: DUF3341 domain-containing protein [Bryobacterales bacterium]|nr:DUF3341 domain-containing protein [Bryobacteraceae bacterium]MDW8353417.1 DUF3341 domain-containing protein [Bryobacterales bacterium]